MKVTDLKEGDTAVITDIRKLVELNGVKNRIKTIGIAEGVTFTVIGYSPLKSAVALRFDGFSVAISVAIAEKIGVEYA